MDNEKNKKSDIVAKILGIILGIVLVLGISYALYMVTFYGKKENKIITGTLRLELLETDKNAPEKYTHIELDNAYPISDEEGINTVPYTFTLKNTGNIDSRYTISLEVLKTSTLPPDTVKFLLQKVDDSLYSIPALLSDRESYLSKNTSNEDVVLYNLGEGIIAVGESIDFSLNLWVDYDANNIAMQKEMVATIRVDGVQKNK